MNAQELQQITEVFEYEEGYAMEHRCSTYFINIAVDRHSRDKVEFEVYVEGVALEYSKAEQLDILNELLEVGEGLRKESQFENDEPWKVDPSDQAKEARFTS